MASRTKQKEEARARRLAEEQARAQQARRSRRLQMLGGVLVIAVAVVAVAIAVSSGGGGTPNVGNVKSGQACKNSTDSKICSLLASIPQKGNALGSPKAPVTVTEYGDLECPICRDFALGIENQLIAKDVRSGRVKLVYKSLETATPSPTIFVPQQAAAGAAGLQNREWYYIEFFYHYQGAEGTGYVNQKYLNNLAKHVPSLNMSKWQSDGQSSTLLNQVKTENSGAVAQGFTSTPTMTIVGPKGQTHPLVGVPNSYGDLETAIDSVS
ncbi:MAG TPA: thioredoxin domain-containing protein [Solirubrobacteraceae bacterium]|jgi:protein-disulfide isomerase